MVRAHCNRHHGQNRGQLAEIAMTQAPSELPKWLPTSVAVMADRIRNKGIGLWLGPADEALVQRLATDERMEKVWRELSRHKSAKPARSKFLSTLDIEPPEDCDPLAEFYYCAYVIAWLGPVAGTLAGRDADIASWKLQAARLRDSAENLIKLSAQFPDPDAKRHVECIEAAAKFCDENAAEFEKLKSAEAPLIVKRDHGNRDARGYVRMLAVEARRLFGMRGDRTLATAASVALAKRISHTQVRKWCTSLD
jgi:hypothetical protein